MNKIVKITFVLLLIAMTIAAIVTLVIEPKNIGSYAAIITVIFFDLVSYVALFQKNSSLYRALHDKILNEEKD